MAKLNSQGHADWPDHPKKQRRTKATHDLPPELCERIRAIAKHLGCSQSDVAAHLLVAGLSIYAAGQLDLISLRRPMKFQLRFTHKLLPAELPAARGANASSANDPVGFERNGEITGSRPNGL